MLKMTHSYPDIYYPKMLICRNHKLNNAIIALVEVNIILGSCF